MTNELLIIELNSVSMAENQALQQRFLAKGCFSPVTDTANSTAGWTTIHQRPLPGLNRWQWWLLVVLNTAFLLIGQSGAVILGRLYYDNGGKSIWIATLIQSAAFPVLLLPLFFFPSAKNHPPTTTTTLSTLPSIPTLTLVYFFFGILLAGDNMLYSIGLLYLPISTYSLISATQLVFNAIFSFFINSQKFTILILNSVVLLTLSSCLVAIHSDSDESKPKEITKRKHTIGFLCTLGASAGYSLLLYVRDLSTTTTSGSSQSSYTEISSNISQDP